MNIDRYAFAEDTMEPSPEGEWVSFEDVKELLESRTLRDWFAGQALMGMLAAGDTEAEVYEAAAEYAYAYADAMLAARTPSNTNQGSIE